MDRINPDWLRTFLEVARTEHLGQAADRLQADQSTVSRKISRLEEEIGVPLFERIGRSIRLSQAGRRFVPRAERLLNEIRDAIADAEGAVAAETGEVHIGFLHTVGTRWLPDRLARFLVSHPAVRFVLAEGTAGEVVNGVVDGTYDLGILGPPPSHIQGLETRPLFREQIAVVVPAGHRLAGSRSCRLDDIADEPLILPRSRSGLRKVIDDAFEARGLVARVAYEGDDLSIVEGLVEAGLGASLLPTPLPAPSTRVSIIPLREPPVARTMALCWDSRRMMPPASRLFSQQLLAEASGRFDLRESA
jgi:DNA-binding transcriptional LysR family regulator